MKRFSVLFLFSLLFLILVTPTFAVTNMISPTNSVSIGITSTQPDIMTASSMAIPNGPIEVLSIETSTKAIAEVPIYVLFGTPANESPLYIAQRESKPFRLYNTGELLTV